MKLLIITQYFWPESFPVNEIAKYMVQRGHTVEVITGIPNYPQGVFYEGYGLKENRHQTWEGININRVRITPRGKSGGDKRLIPNYLSYVIFGKAAVRKIHDNQYDVAFVNAVSPITQAYPALLLKKKRKTPIVLYVGDLWPDTLFAHGLKNGLIHKMIVGECSKIYRKCDSVIATCESFIPRLKAYGCSDVALKFIPQWSDEFYTLKDSPMKIRAKLGIKADDFVVMFAGNIGYAQSMETIMQVIKAVKNETNIKFVFVGDGTQKQYCMDFCTKEGLESCYFIGKKATGEMADIIAEADAMLVTLKDRSNYNLTVPTRVQAFMACGKPLLVSANGATQKLVKDSGTGLVSDAGNVEFLAGNIRIMASMSCDQIGEVGKRCLEFAGKYYNKSIILADIEKVLYETANKK